MGFHCPGHKIKDLRIGRAGGNHYFLYLNQRRVDTPLEMIIGPVLIVEGPIIKCLATKIAAWRGVVYAIDNFGGHSSGDPSIIEPVFTVPLKRNDIRDYIKPSSKEVKKELKEAEEKLVKAVEGLDEAIELEAESILQRLPEHKRESDLKRIREIISGRPRERSFNLPRRMDREHRL